MATDARRVIDANLKGAESAIKWAHPTWSLGKQPVCHLKAASKHVTFGFWRGASIDDPSGRLETAGEVMAHAKLRTRDDIDEKLFATRSNRRDSRSGTELAVGVIVQTR